MEEQKVRLRALCPTHLRAALHRCPTDTIIDEPRACAHECAFIDHQMDKHKNYNGGHLNPSFQRAPLGCIRMGSDRTPGDETASNGEAFPGETDRADGEVPADHGEKQTDPIPLTVHPIHF